MNSIAQELKSNILGVIFKVTHAIYGKILILSIIRSLIALGIMIPVLIYVIGFDMEAYFELAMAMQDNPLAFEEVSQEMLYMFQDVFNFGNLIILIVVILILALISTYVTYLAFVYSKETILGRKVNFDEMFKPFNGRVGKLLLATILYYFIYSIILGAAMFILAFTLFFAIILIPAAMFFISALFMRYILIFPSIALSEEDNVEHIEYSASRINYKKGMKYTLIAILYIIGIAIIQSILGQIGALAGGQSIWVQMGVNQVIGFFITAYALAFSISAQSSLYMRDKVENTDAGEYKIEDHLVE